MNRSVSRVMVGVAGLAVLGMIATLAGAFAGTAMAQAPSPATQISEVPDKFVVPEAQNDYFKRIEMIPMRDGVKLYTVIIVPKGAKDDPIVLTRTPNNANRPTSLSSVAFAAGLSEQLRAQTPAPGTSFRDCSNGCPEMVVVQRGRFTMGTPAGEEERENWPKERRGHSVPQHLVTIRDKFAMAKFDVTRDEYAQFVAETNRPDSDSCVTVNAPGTDFITIKGNWHSPGFPQTGKDPAVCVSWDDAHAYVSWLSAKTGHAYRLPTEAEWEYAARAGTTTARYGSDNPAEVCRYTNVADQDYSKQHPGDSGANLPCRDGYAFTSPVESFPPNQFGLHDMLGNVMNWTEDCVNANYSGAPTDGTAWQSGDCSRRIVRGGSWDMDLRGARSANRRISVLTSGRNATLGFRVARTL